MTKFIVFKMYYVSTSFVRILRDSMHRFAFFEIRGQSVLMKYIKYSKEATLLYRFYLCTDFTRYHLLKP